MPCQLEYIPHHLRTNGRENINQFYIGEFLYRRSKKEERDNPFDTISLVDISVNRGGASDNRLSEPEDVLYNVNPERYGALQRLDLVVSYLEIEELTDLNIYEKSERISQTDNQGNPITNECKIVLCHKNEECMYPHSAFEVYYNDIEMTMDNYKHYLGKNTRLRTWCKNELSKMIMKEVVRINWEFYNELFKNV